MANAEHTARMDFPDLEPVMVPVVIGKPKKLDADGNPLPTHWLREVDEGGAVKYQNMSMKAARFSDEGKVNSVDGAADVEPLLVQLCLFEADIDGKPQFNKDGKLIGAVAKGYVDALPARIVKPLFERAVEISGLAVKETLVTIDKKIADLTKKRVELEKAQGVESPKDQPTGMPTTSA